MSKQYLDSLFCLKILLVISSRKLNYLNLYLLIFRLVYLYNIRCTGSKKKNLSERMVIESIHDTGADYASKLEIVSSHAISSMHSVDVENDSRHLESSVSNASLSEGSGPAFEREFSSSASDGGVTERVRGHRAAEYTPYRVDEATGVTDDIDIDDELRSRSFSMPDYETAMQTVWDEVNAVRLLVDETNARTLLNETSIGSTVRRLDAMDRETFVRLTALDRTEESADDVASILANGRRASNFSDVMANLEQANSLVVDLSDTGFAAEDLGRDSNDPIDTSRTATAGVSAGAQRGVVDVEQRKALVSRQTTTAKSQFVKIRNDINSMLNEGVTKFRLLGLDLSRFHETIANIKERTYVLPEVAYVILL